MALAGPLLQIEVAVPEALASYLGSQNLPIPSPQVGWALIDTGASKTCVDDRILVALGVKPTGTIETGTAGGKTTRLKYPARLSWPSGKLVMDFGSVIGVDLRGQKVADKDIIALLGRDVLSHCLLVYNGPGAVFSVAV
jgi:hypothetical protein